MSSSTEDLRVELGYLRDNIVEAVSQRKTSIVESGLDTYEALVATFIDVLKEFGSPYDRKQALAEIHSLEGGWSEIRWVRDDYREIADAALASRNLSVLEPVIYFPVGLSRLAYREGDYYIFAQFLNWLPYLYTEAVQQLAIEEATPNLSDRESLFGVVRGWLATYPRELADFQIGHDINESGDAAAIRSSCEFARGIFTTFNRLLKSAYDERRVRDFQDFASELQDLYRHQVNDSTTVFLSTEAEQGPNDAEGAPVSPDVVRAECYQGLSRLRQVIFLGLEGWLLHEYATDKLSLDHAEAFRGSAYLPSSIPDLWRLYLEARRERYEDELDWRWWESREHRGRAAYAGIAFDLLVLKPILLRMLVTASSMEAAQIEALPLDLTRDLDYLVGKGSGPLIETLSQVADSAELRELATFDPAAAIGLRKRLLALGEEQANEEQKQLIDASLSSERIEEMKRNVLRGRREGGYLRDLVQHRGKYEFAGEPPSGLGSLSIHRWEPKDLYVERSRFSTSTWGLDYGRSLAKGEDELVVDQIASVVPALSPDPVDPKAVVGYLDQALSARTEIPKPVILFVGSLGAGWALAESGRFEYSRHVPFGEERKGEPNPSGYFDNVPVYQIHSNAKPLAVVADLARLGTWQQYRPKGSDLSEYLEDVILFELETYTEAKARDLLDEQPDTFRFDVEPSGDRRERSVEERISQVLQHVRLLILEQLQFEITNVNAGRVIRLTE
jgi:hypothetical protein